MLEFENFNDLKKVIKDSKDKTVPSLSVFQSFFRMFLFLAFYAMIIIVVTLVMYKVLDKSAKIVKVPSVMNKSFLEGYMALRKVNLNVDVVIQDYNDVPEGRVTAQSIAPNSQVKEKRKIVLTVSSGQRLATSGTSSDKFEDDMRSIYLTVPIPKDLSEFNTKSEQVTVKVYITDDGEHKNDLVYSDKADAGENLKIQLQVSGKVKEKVYINGVLYLEKEIQ